jgi:hypothetical protein
MFQQLLTPVSGSLGLSFVVACLPILTVLILLGVLRRPAWQASLAGLVVGLIVAVAVWRLPIGLALDSVFNGVVFALWPVMWIVFNALLLYNIAVRSGRFESFRIWLLNHLPNDRRIILVVIGFCFGALLEGVAGFGTPVAITSSLLILVGFPPLEALVFVLIFNTAPVAFGALGAPVTVLGAVTGLPPTALGAMIGRQLPIIALILPFYVMALYGGARSIRALWPVLLVAGASFALSQFVASNFLDYTLTDVLASLGSLIVTLLFLQVWRPAPDAEFAVHQKGPPARQGAGVAISPWQGWLPWIIVSVVVILWTTFKIFAIGQAAVHWPGLDNSISITLYNNKPYAAVWVFQPGDRHRHSSGGDRDGRGFSTQPGRFLFLRRQHRPSDLAGGGDRLLHRRPRLSDELLGARLYARPRRGVGGRPVRAAVAVPRLGRRLPVGQRHFRQCAVRQSAGRRFETARPQSAAVRGDQFFRGRDGQNDLAAEYCDGRFGDRSQGPGRPGVFAHLHPQRHTDRIAGPARRLAAICHSVGHSGGRAIARIPSPARRKKVAGEAGRMRVIRHASPRGGRAS